MRDQFLLNPDVIFLNHGSFGATPKPVFEHYLAWQREMEAQPVAFYQRRYDALMNEARAVLAQYVGAQADNLVFVPNASVGLNTVAHALPLQAGDEILTTDHEYGALDLTWHKVCQRTGAKYIRQQMPSLSTLSTPEAFSAWFWAGVTDKTRVIFISHITSPTALIFPIEALIEQARARGIWTVIDGAHAPSQLDLQLEALGADFYSGNCHKWLCAPKSAGFLHVRPEHQALIDPLTISWGCSEGASFAMRHQWQGTQNVAAYLSVPSAIEFQAQHDWEAVRSASFELARWTHEQISALTGLEPLSPATRDYFVQMVALPLPITDPINFKARLLDEFRIEVPITNYQSPDGQKHHFVRASYQAYNTRSDAEALIQALRQLL